MTWDWLAIVSIGTLLGTVVIAIATIALFRATRVLATETKRMADLTSEPHVVAAIRPNRWTMMHADLEIENTGTATAYEIEIGFDPPLQVENSSGEHDRLPLQKVSLLQPQRAIASYLSEFPPLLEKTFMVRVSWKKSPSSKEREVNEYRLDLTNLKGVSQLGASDPLVQIADDIKKIREEVAHLASGWRKPRVDVFTSADRQAERDALEREIEERRRRAAGPEDR